jgi:lipopolysaccharide/colanic/teichoic acid biosynthesis glycosyltransferase
VSTAELSQIDLRTAPAIRAHGASPDLTPALLRQPGKRLFDIAVATVLLLALLPLLALVAIVVFLGDRGPVLYRQRRVGAGGRPFEILKFRSMTEGADRDVIDLTDSNLTDGLLFKVRDDPRVTPVGRVIRRLSIDELPQLWNVLRGDMSVVGPRPLAVEPHEFDPVEHKRHRVRPGITGSWQVSGGNGLRYRDMIDLDFEYIDGWSLWLDVKMLLATIPALFDRTRPV